MEFIDEQRKKVYLSVFSKSFGETFDECKLKAWFKVRNKKAFISSKPLELGKYAHALFATSVANLIGEEYYVNEEQLTNNPAIKFEAKSMMRRINLDRFISSKDEVIGFEKIVKHTLDLPSKNDEKNQIEIMGIFDLILFKDSPRGSYIEVFDFKTGYKLAKEVDLQCMVYVYLAAKLYPGFPVLFRTYSGRTGDEWGRFFKEEEALSMEEEILSYASEIKEVVESEYMPQAKAGAHCLNCPFLDACTSRDLEEETDVTNVMNKYQQYKSKIKEYEEKLKNFRTKSPKDEAVITDSGFVIDFSESLSIGIATPKVSKKDLLVLLARSGELEEVLDSLDISFTDKVVAKAKALGIDFKPKITRRLGIKALSTEEGEEDE